MAEATQLAQLAGTLEDLYTVYTDEGVALWLRSAQVAFDGKSPIDLIREGEVYELAAAVSRLLDGAFS